MIRDFVRYSSSRTRGFLTAPFLCAALQLGGCATPPAPIQITQDSHCLRTTKTDKGPESVEFDKECGRQKTQEALTISTAVAGEALRIIDAAVSAEAFKLEGARRLAALEILAAVVKNTKAWPRPQVWEFSARLLDAAHSSNTLLRDETNTVLKKYGIKLETLEDNANRFTLLTQALDGICGTSNGKKANKKLCEGWTAPEAR